MKFIHAADLHIDSPLRGLQAYEGAPAEQVRGATRQALANLVQLALDEAVDFVIVAGDLFDGQWPHMETGLWTANQFRRLQQADIPLYWIRGNHDAASKVRQSVTWPDNVRELSVRRPETIVREQQGVAIHGQGFAHPAAPDDLAAEYPQRIEGMFNIGVLHTSLTGNTDHDTYAPTTVEVLANHGYDYWALGHIHTRSDPPICRDPYIAFSGNTQGRHFRETGPKGCLLVSDNDRGSLDARFVATDSLRWSQTEIDLDETDGLPELLQRVQQKFEQLHALAEGRFLAVRLAVCGTSPVHAQLSHKNDYEAVVAEIRNLANEWVDEIWLENIAWNVGPPVDLDQLRQGKDLLGDLLRSIQQYNQDDDCLNQLSSNLEPLWDKAGLELNEAEILRDDPDQLRQWIRDAERLLVSQLLEADQ